MSQPTSINASNVIELRRLLAEKFPGLRTRLEEEPATPRAVWRTGVAQVDEALRGGLPEGAMTEVVASKTTSGSALLMRTLIQQAAEKRQITAVIDGHDSLDVASMPQDTLARLLWVRCGSTDEALQAADMILRDGNLPLVLIDLVSNPAAEIRKIPATMWYRFQRLVEEKTTVCIIFTPRMMVMPAQARITLTGGFSLDAIERKAEELLLKLKMEVADSKQQRGGVREKFA